MPADALLRFLADPASGAFDDLAAAAGDSGSPPETELRRAAVAALLAGAGVSAAERQPVLALAGEGESALADELLASRADDAGLRPIKPRGVDPAAARSWLAARQRDHRPALLVGPPEGLTGLLGPIERRGLRFRLPAGSAGLVLRGPGTAPDPELRARLVDHLGLSPERLWLAWEAPRVATPFLARWDGRDRFAIPHWVRVGLDDEGRPVIVDLALGDARPVVAAATVALSEAGFTLS